MNLKANTIAICLVLLVACTTKKRQKPRELAKTNTETPHLTEEDTILPDLEDPYLDSVPEDEQIKQFIPDGYHIFDKLVGDLNGDGELDCVLLIKAIDPTKIVVEEYRGVLDKNRRGLIILFAKQDGFEKIIENINCFSSENEDGGVYYAPELFLKIEKGILNIQYAHGRYGSWEYYFRYNGNDFDLIAFEELHMRASITLGYTYHDFLTLQKTQETITNLEQVEEGNTKEKFEKTISKIETKPNILLSQVIDFDEINLNLD